MNLILINDVTLLNDLNRLIKERIDDIQWIIHYGKQNDETPTWHKKLAFYQELTGRISQEIKVLRKEAITHEL